VQTELLEVEPLIQEELEESLETAEQLLEKVEDEGRPLTTDGYWREQGESMHVVPQGSQMMTMALVVSVDPQVHCLRHHPQMMALAVFDRHCRHHHHH
jgi:hypothetical protein